MVFHATERENRLLEDLPQADFGRVYENISSVNKEKVNNWEFCAKNAHFSEINGFSSKWADMPGRLRWKPITA